MIRTPSNYGDEMLTCTCSFNVAKGEEKPELGNVGLVTGVANKSCNWSVPYQVSYLTQQIRLSNQENTILRVSMALLKTAVPVLSPLGEKKYLF